MYGNNFSHLKHKQMKKTIIALTVLLLMSTASFAQTHSDTTMVHKKTTTTKKTTGSTKYTCSMHPEVVMSKPGKCPKCGMKLMAVGSKKTTTTKKSEMKM